MWTPAGTPSTWCSDSRTGFATAQPLPEALGRSLCSGPPVVLRWQRFGARRISELHTGADRVELRTQAVAEEGTTRTLAILAGACFGLTEYAFGHTMLDQACLTLHRTFRR